MDVYRDSIWLSHMNSGCSIPWKHKRSYETFQRIADYPFAKRGRTAAELCVDYAVLDVDRFVKYVVEIKGGSCGNVLYEA